MSGLDRSDPIARQLDLPGGLVHVGRRLGLHLLPVVGEEDGTAAASLDGLGKHLHRRPPFVIESLDLFVRLAELLAWPLALASLTARQRER